MAQQPPRHTTSATASWHAGLLSHGEPPVYFTFPGLARLGLAHAATTRHCPGVTAWREAGSPFGPEAETALGAAGFDFTRLAWARQVHGSAVARVSRDGGFAGTADVLTTTERRVPLTIFTADCLGIILYDPVAPALAVAHVGWRGTVGGAAQSAVAAVCAAGARVERLHAAIAPSIGPCCYEVDEPVVSAFQSAYPDASRRWLQPVRAGHWMLDLWQANEELLERTGVEPTRIENARLCTASHPDLLFSYRRGQRGRLLTLAALP
jgi:YfiH family protein